MDRFTVSYTTKSGESITLYNLLPEGLKTVVDSQTYLGSNGFKVERQPHNYSQIQIDLLRGAPLRAYAD